MTHAREKLAAFFQWYYATHGAVPRAAVTVNAGSAGGAGGTIVLEGAPCIGKTTLVRSLSRILTSGQGGARAPSGAGGEVVVHEEERDDLLLDDFLRDPPRFAFTFQMYKLARRQQLCSDLAHAMVARPRTHWLLDRMLPGDMCFALHAYVVGQLTREQLAFYVTRALAVVQPTAWRVVYMAAPPQVLVTRVGRRGNSDEMRLYDVSYFERMDVCLRAAFDVLRTPFVELEWGADVVLEADGCLPAEVCTAVLSVIRG